MFNDATDKEAEHKSPCDIRKAIKELDPETFTLWFQLHVIDPVHLQRGIANLGRVTAIAKSSLLRRLQRLTDGGFVELISGGHGSPTVVGFSRRHSA